MAESTFRAVNRFPGCHMTLLFADTKPDTVWRRARRGLTYVRDWPANGNSPYSPLFCISLLLAVALIVEIGPSI